VSVRSVLLLALVGCGDPSSAPDAGAPDAHGPDAAPHPVEWQQSFGGLDSYDWGNGVVADAEGTVYVVGQHYPLGPFVARLDRDGNLMWQQTLPLTGSGLSNYHVLAPSAEIIAVAEVGVVVAPYRSGAVYAFAPDGTPFDIVPPACPVLSVRPFGSFTTQCATELARIDFFGNTEWTVTPAASVDAVSVAPSGELVAVAMTDHLYMARWSATGELRWTRTLAASELPTTACRGSAMVVAEDRTYVICRDVVLAIDDGGALLWTRATPSLNGWSRPTADDDGNLLLAGYSGNVRAATAVKLDATGHTLWERDFSPLFSEFLAVTSTPAASVVAAGFQQGANNYDVMVVQLAP
jgi:outer membrane protein assembly factor BamB